MHHLKALGCYIIRSDFDTLTLTPSGKWKVRWKRIHF